MQICSVTAAMVPEAVGWRVLLDYKASLIRWFGRHGSGPRIASKAPDPLGIPLPTPENGV
jgi:hypothetical protein